MITPAQLTHFIEQVEETCGPNARYRTLWLTGEPRSGKSTFVREACERAGWHYLNYTTDPRGLAMLAGQEGLYQPRHFVEWMRATGAQVDNNIIVVDEIESLLGWWDHDRQRNFFRTVSISTSLPKGFVLVTRLRFAASQLPSVVPNRFHLLELNEVLQ